MEYWSIGVLAGTHHSNTPILQSGIEAFRLQR